MSPLDKPDAYFGLLDELRAIVGTKIDLVMVQPHGRDHEQARLRAGHARHDADGPDR
jgi:hypothetical protein